MEDIMVKIFCNACGKELKVDNGIPKEDFIRICKSWGYFSKKVYYFFLLPATFFLLPLLALPQLLFSKEVVRSPVPDNPF